MKKIVSTLSLLLIIFSASSQSVAVTKTNPTKVYMHYMPWFDAPQNPVAGGTYSWGWHWKMNTRNPNIIDAAGKRQIASHYYPLIGPYSSNDAAVVEYHSLLMKLSGIDGVLVDWYGSEGSNSDVGSLLANSNVIINRVSDAGLQFGLVMEDRFWSNIQNARNSITYAKNNYFNRSNFIKSNNSPLLGVFGPITYQTPAQWTDILSYAGQDVEFLPLWYENADAGTNADGECAWIYSDYLTGLNNFYANRAPSLKTAIGVAYPGFHDYYLEGGAGTSYFYLPENNGVTLNETLVKYDQYKANLDGIQLATFNDFGEGTMFEPTLEYGYNYLVKIQQYTGVPYTQSDLEKVYRLFSLRKKYLSDAAKQLRLNQVFNYFNALQISSATALMDSVDAVVVVAAPVISGATTAAGISGLPFSYTVTASNSPTAYGATGLPTGLLINVSTGVISGTPTVVGVFPATITATNAGGTGSATLNITINPAAPVITSAATKTGTTGTALTYNITASNSPTTYSASGLPVGLSVNTTTGLISGTPLVPGVSSVVISAANITGTATKTITITIADPAGVITCLKASGAITINGSLTENGWNITRSFSKNVTGVTNNTGTFGVLWDNTNLYIGAKILDASLKSESVNVWDDDAVEIFIDANNDRSTTYNGKDNQLIKTYNKSSVYSKLPITGLQHAWAAIVGGFAVEIAIPWSQLGISAPAAGTTIGFDIGNDDDDNGGVRDGQMVWNGTINNFQSTAGYGKLKLTTTVANAPAARAFDAQTLTTQNTGIRIVPNPADNNNIDITLPNWRGMVDIQLLSSNGVVVKTDRKKINHSSLNVNLSGVPSGIYFIQIKNNAQSVVQKFVKE